MLLPINQRGISQIILPLFLLAAIGLTVYLAQQPTELTPSAAVVTEAPTGCKKVTPISRSICYKKSATSPPEQCRQSDREAPHEFKEYPIKEITWTFSDGWKNVGSKGENQADGDRFESPSVPPRFDSSSGKSYEKIDNDRIEGDGNRIAYRVKNGGQAVVAEYAYTKIGTNFQGVTTNPDGSPARTYDKDKSFAFVPTDENSGVRCDGIATSTTTGSKNNGAACTANKGTECKSGICTNSVCAQGAKKGNESCKNKEECESDTCSNGRCSGGSRANGQSCDGPSECASNKCESNKCIAAIASSSPTRSGSATPRASSGSGGSGGGGSTITPAPAASGADIWQAVELSRCIQACGSTFPSTGTCYFNQARNLYNCSRSVGSYCENNNWCDSGFCDISKKTCQAQTTGDTTLSTVSLTKAEITGFRNSYNALAARLGTATNSGNLRVVSGIAGPELDSIVTQLPTCPDDVNVGKCLDDKFRTRFDFAKTAARLSAFYAIFNSVSGICVKSDFGLNPLITAASQNNLQGRVNLCSEPTAAQKVWRIFVGGKFEQVLSTDTRWPSNPTCATLPQDVLTHYRNAETLFNTQAGFTLNTLCDGKTLVVPGGGI